MLLALMPIVSRHETVRLAQAWDRRLCLEVPIATIFDFHNSARTLQARLQQCVLNALLL
jgi:hypothetical protein